MHEPYDVYAWDRSGLTHIGQAVDTMYLAEDVGWFRGMIDPRLERRTVRGPVPPAGEGYFANLDVNIKPGAGTAFVYQLGPGAVHASRLAASVTVPDRSPKWLGLLDVAFTQFEAFFFPGKGISEPSLDRARDHIARGSGPLVMYSRLPGGSIARMRCADLALAFGCAVVTFPRISITNPPERMKGTESRQGPP